jgi:hypothetical protein
MVSPGVFAELAVSAPKNEPLMMAVVRTEAATDESVAIRIV